MLVLKRVLFAYSVATGLLISGHAFAGKGPSVENVTGATTIHPEKAKELWLNGVVFIDTRKKADWDAGRVPGAIHISVKKPDFNADYIAKYVAKNEPVVSYCNAQLCHRAAKAAKKLVEYGYTEVYYFRSGFPSWKNANYPYE